MELPKLKNNNVFGPLKFNNRLPSNNALLLSSLQSDNIFIKNKLAEFEVRLDDVTNQGICIINFLLS